MVKRLRGIALQKHNEKLRRDAEAAEAAKSELELTTELLTELAEKQKKYIQEAENLLTIWSERYTRLSYSESFLKNSKERDDNMIKLVLQIEIVKKECEDSELILDNISLMKEQIKRLEIVFKESVKYQGVQFDLEPKKHGIHMRVPDQTHIDTDLNTLPSLNELLVNTGASARLRVPLPLRPDDLDEIKWPEEINYDKYSIHLAKNTELAVQCRKRRQEIEILDVKFDETSSYKFSQTNKVHIKCIHEHPRSCATRLEGQQNSIKEKYADWKTLITKKHTNLSTIAALKEEEKRLSALQDSRDAQFKKIREQVNQEEYLCEICLQLMTNGDNSVRCPKIFGSCGHTACAECMIQFAFPVRYPVPHIQWKCPECRTESSQIVTNWTIMKKINPKWHQKIIHIE